MALRIEKTEKVEIINNVPKVHHELIGQGEEMIHWEYPREG